MSDHPGDTASKRFSAFWLGMGGIFLFGILTWLIWLFSNTDEVISATEQEVIDGRLAIRAEVEKEQAGLLEKLTPAVEAATIATLKEKAAPSKSEIPVEGTPAFQELQRKLAAEAAAAAEAKKAEEGKGKEEPNKDAKPPSE